MSDKQVVYRQLFGRKSISHNTTHCQSLRLTQIEMRTENFTLNKIFYLF